MRQVSIKSVMLYVSFIAFGLAALRNANEVWAGVMLLLTFGALGTAALAILHRRGRARAWSQGFAGFGLAYMLIAVGPGVSSHVGPHLGTTSLLSTLHSLAVEPRLSRSYAGSEESLLPFLTDLAQRQKDSGHTEQAKKTEADLTIITDRLIERGSDLTEGLDRSPAARMRIRISGVLPGAANEEEFLLVGHCMFALLAGLIGAAISSRMYREQT